MSAVAGVVLLLCGLLMPAHLRAVDVSVIQKAGERTQTLVAEGLELAGEGNLGAARLLWRAAQMERLPGREALGTSLASLEAQPAAWKILGSPDPRLEQLIIQSALAPAGTGDAAAAPGPSSAPEPFTTLLVHLETRERALQSLRASPNPGIQEVLRCRDLTNTVILPPSSSASGQPFDTAIAVCGLLMDEKALTPSLSNKLYALAWAANHGANLPLSPEARPPGLSWNSEPLEQVLLDLLSLGQRFNWGQYVLFTRSIQDIETLRRLAFLVRKTEGQLPVLYGTVTLSGQPGRVAGYLMKFSESGLEDLGSSLQFGAGALKEVLARNQRCYTSAWGRRMAAHPPLDALMDVASDYSWLMPWVSLGLKWFLYLCAGFLLACAMHFAQPAAQALEQPLQVRGVHFARESLFALGFLLVVLIVTEPFLSQQGQSAELPFRVRLPFIGQPLPAAVSNLKLSLMDPNLLTLLLFFVLQALIYTACLVKLAEIRRQKVVARIKLKLLENEDHLFDAGLYVGFVGTIISLILVSLHYFQFSLMAAYSSTSFGIIFVVIFKIFHLRPSRRRLLLEAEAAAMALEAPAPAPAPSPTLATPS